MLSAHISCDSTPQHVHHPQHPCECDSCLPSLFAVCHNDALHHLRVGADGGHCGDKLEARVETISGDRLSLSLCCCLPWARNEVLIKPEDALTGPAGPPGVRGVFRAQKKKILKKHLFFVFSLFHLDLHVKRERQYLWYKLMGSYRKFMHYYYFSLLLLGGKHTHTHTHTHTLGSYGQEFGSKMRFRDS